MNNSGRWSTSLKADTHSTHFLYNSRERHRVDMTLCINKYFTDTSVKKNIIWSTPTFLWLSSVQYRHVHTERA